MKIEIQITPHHIEPAHGFALEFTGVAGAVADFSGVVRGEENGEAIAALEYEAFSPMAENEMRRILVSLAESYPCLAARVIHRVGIIPAGDIAIQVVILARHREAAFATLSGFMNRLKQDVPIWKRRALPLRPPGTQRAGEYATAVRPHKHIPSVDEALEAIRSHVTSLHAVPTPLEQAGGRILLETVYAREDLPTVDRSTRDGFAILQGDSSSVFQVVDTLYAADWKPRALKTGEAVRVATGSAMPCENLRVVMQEDVEREGDSLKLLSRDDSGNIRRRGEEMTAGQPILPAGTRLNAGALALLATIGCTRPKVSPRLKVLHFLTGDELVPPDQKPMPGQIRDSNSIFIRGCLQTFPAELRQQRLPEDFERAKAVVIDQRPGVEAADVLFISGGASVGDKDFTRKLLDFLGFQIVFQRVNVRPGAPLIFGVAGHRIAFGLPGNPLAHFVTWHAFVAVALARLTGGTPPVFSRGTLVSDLLDAGCPRETLWPARCQISEGKLELTPLRWNSSGDVTCLADANALIRVPVDTAELKAGAPVEFTSF
jgi:molybdopterin molybdotransferase